MDRRTLLALSTAGAGFLAGCSALGDALDGAPAEDAIGETTPRATASTSTAADGPSLPYRAETPDANVDWARGVGVYNDRNRAVYATVIVTDGDRTVYAASDEIATGDTWSHESLILRRGVYRLLVETADGDRAVHGMTVGDAWGNVTVEIDDDGIDTEQTGVCAPACPPVSTGGESIELPKRERYDAGQEVAGIVFVENGRAETAPVTVTVARDGDELVDFRYAVPPGVTVAVPAARRDGVHDLRVTSDGSAVADEWHVPEERFPRIRVGANGVAPTCEADAARVTTVENVDDRSHSVRATLRADGRQTASRRVDLLTGDTRTLGVAVRGDRLTVDLSVDGERALSATWTLCPPGPLRVLVFSGFVALRNDARVVRGADIE